MSKDRNVCSFTGRMTRNPEVKAVGENSVTNFAIAVNSIWKNSGGEKCEQATFVEFDAWNGTGKFIAEYCKKGDFVLVDAEYQQRSVDKDGEKRTFHRFRVNSLQKLNWEKRSEDDKPTKPTKATKSKKIESVEEDDLPF